MNGHTVLYDPEGRIETQLPLDRATRERVVRAVLAWSDPAALRPDDYEQVGLLLSGAAHAVAADVRACAGRLPDDDGRPLLAEIVLGKADSRLPLRSRNMHRVKNKARMLRALYERLDRTGSRTQHPPRRRPQWSPPDRRPAPPPPSAPGDPHEAPGGPLCTSTPAGFRCLTWSFAGWRECSGTSAVRGRSHG
ncbi:hypothetical protein, partial [Streptomyces sp. NPDC020298]|uniref:hypothetical protein n=1 Tax=unclassified Streptomyces TaxID=2593676 RepID=UPI0034115D05